MLEKYGEKITPEVRSPVANGNPRGRKLYRFFHLYVKLLIIDQPQRVSIRPSITGAEKPMISGIKLSST